MVKPIIERSEAFLTFFCECTIIARFGLPCRYKFLRAVREGFSFSISLVYSRWWLDGFPDEPSGWKSKYFNAAIDLSKANFTTFITLTQNETTRSVFKIKTFRKALNGEKQTRFN